MSDKRMVKMKMIVNRDTVSRNPYLIHLLNETILSELPFFEANYPKFNEWFLHSVLPGIEKSERTIVIEKRNDCVVGLLVLKHTIFESKLCTLRVSPCYEGTGLGIRLFETAFELLETEAPLLSVSENNFPKFSKIFEYFGFIHENTYSGLYKPSVEEFSFNGLLDN